MPKKLKDSEKEYIKKRLKEEAFQCLTTYGVKKTTVDELVKRVNIPKGTFYLFYESKELLLFDAIMEIHNIIMGQLETELSGISDDITAEELTRILYRLFKEMDQSGLMPVILSGELELLIRKLPEEIVKEHLSQDDFHVRQLLKILKLEDTDYEVISGAFRAAFITMLYQREIGNEVYDDVLRMLLKGIILQMMEIKSRIKRERVEKGND